MVVARICNICDSKVIKACRLRPFGSRLEGKLLLRNGSTTGPLLSVWGRFARGKTGCAVDQANGSIWFVCLISYIFHLFRCWTILEGGGETLMVTIKLSHHSLFSRWSDKARKRLSRTVAHQKETLPARHLVAAEIGGERLWKQIVDSFMICKQAHASHQNDHQNFLTITRHTGRTRVERNGTGSERSATELELYSGRTGTLICGQVQLEARNGIECRRLRRRGRSGARSRENTETDEEEN